MSRGGCLYARKIFGVAVRDLTSGFKCYGRNVLETIGLDRVRSEGYAFQIEMVYRAIRHGFRVVENPIVFADREAGVSKMSLRVVLEGAARVPALRLTAVSSWL